VGVVVSILTTYNGAGAKRATRDLALMQKQATLAGSTVTASMLGAAAGMNRVGASTAATGALWSKRLTLPILAFGAASVIAAETVDQGLNQVRSGTGATGKQLASLETSFRNVAQNSGKDFKTIGTTIADVNTRLGLTGRPLEQLTTKFLTLSRVTGQDVGPMMTEVTKAMNDSGIKSGEAAGFLDKLLVASQKTGASVSDLATDMYKYGSPLRQLGFGVDETIATLGSFDKAGVNTKLVMGSLRIALGNMARAGEKDLPAALAKSIEAIKNAKTGGEAAAQAVELFGARAGPDMAAAIREGRFEVADLVRQLQGSEGAVERTGDATLTFSGKMARLRNQAALAGEGFGRILLPYLTQIAEGAIKLAKHFQGLSKGWRDVIVKVGLFAAAIGPVLVIVGKLTSGVGRMIGVAGKLTLAFGNGAKAAPTWARGIAAATKGLAGFVKQSALALAGLARQAAAWVAAKAATIAHSVATKAAAAAQWLLNAAMSANPIGLIVLAIAALVGVFIVLWKKCDWFRNFWIGVWEHIKVVAAAVWPVIKAVGEKIVAALQWAWDKVSAGISWFWDWAGPWIKEHVALWWEAIKIIADWIVTGVSALWDKVSAAVSWFWGWAGPFITEHVKGWWTIIKTTFETIQTVTRTVWDVIKTIVSTAINNIKTAIHAVQTVVAFVRGVWDSVRDVTRTIWNAVVNFVSGLGDRIVSAVRSVSAVVGYVRDVFANAKEAAIDKLQALINWVRGVDQKIKGAIGDAGKILYSAGQDIVLGLRDGIVAAWHWVTEKLHALIDGLSGAAKKLLGINSPSKVFAGVGLSVGEGFAEGIEASIAAAAAAARSMAGGAIGGVYQPASSGVSRPAVGARSVTIAPGAVVVHIDGAGSMSASELTGAVRSGVEPALARLAVELQYL